MATEFEVTLKDGTVMKGWHWEAKSSKKNFVFITGMNEHVSRYDEMFTRFAKNGINVWGIDALAQGRNAATPEEQELWGEDAFAKNVEGIHEAILLAKQNGLPTVQGTFYGFLHDPGKAREISGGYREDPHHRLKRRAKRIDETRLCRCQDARS